MQPQKSSFLFTAWLLMERGKIDFAPTQQLCMWKLCASSKEISAFPFPFWLPKISFPIIFFDF